VGTFDEQDRGTYVITNNSTGRRCRWTPSRVLEILRNPTYTGRLPFNGEAHQAQHAPLVDAEVFARAQRIVAERERSWRDRAANATDYLLTRFLRCGRCGYGFVGTAAHGNGGAYRYYTCFARQRHGTKRCDQQRIPADPLEEAILAEVLAALQDGAIFQEAAARARQAWQDAHPGRRAELAGVDQALTERRAAVDRYLRAFEAGRLSEATCGHRVGALEQEIGALEARRASLLAECDTEPALPTGGDLDTLRRQIEQAIADAAPEQLKRLLDAVVERITVESRACIQPYFFAPAVRTLTAPREADGNRTRLSRATAHTGFEDLNFSANVSSSRNAAGQRMSQSNIGENLTLLSNGSNGDSVPATVPQLGLHPRG
jgi:hypothetical protein